MSAKSDIIAKYSTAPAAKPVPTIASPLAAATSTAKPALPVPAAKTTSAAAAIIAKYSTPQKKFSLSPNENIAEATDLGTPVLPTPKKDSFITKALTKVGQFFDQPDQSQLTGDVTQNTIRELPSAFVENLPFGIGAAIKQIHDDPESAAAVAGKDNVDLFKNLAKSTPAGLLDAGKGFVKTPISGAANLAFVPVKFNIPGLGEITNREYNAAYRISQGEDPVAVSLDEASGGVLDTLFFLDIVSKPFKSSSVDVAQLDAEQSANLSGDKGGTIGKTPKAATPRSFRSYEKPTVTTPTYTELNPEFIARMKSEGVDLSKYDPSKPTYFRFEMNEAGEISGKVIQVKPSFFEDLKTKLSASKPAAAPESAPGTPETGVAKFEGEIPPDQYTVIASRYTSAAAIADGVSRPQLLLPPGKPQLALPSGTSEGAVPPAVQEVLTEPASPETIQKIIDFSPEESAAFGRKIIGDINAALGTSINEKLGEALPDNIKLTENPSHDGRPAQFNNQGKIEIFLPDLVKDIKSMANGNQILAHDGKYSKVYKLEKGETINELAVRYIKDIIIHEASHQETLTIGDQTTALELQRQIRQARVDGNAKEVTRIQTELDKHRAGLETKALDYEALNRGALEKKYFTSPRSPSVDTVLGKPKPKEVTTNEKTALKTKLKAEEKGSKSGLKEGKKQGRAEVSADEQNRANTREIGDERKSFLDKLKQRIVDRSRASKQVEGVKSQYRQAIDKIKDRNTTIQESRQILTEYAKLVPAAVRGKFIVRIQNATSAKEFRDTIQRMREVTDLHERKIVRLEIKKALKNTVVKKVNGYPNAKFEIQAQRDLNRIRAGIKEDYGDAQQKIADLIVKFTTENPEAQGVDDATVREIQFLKMVGIKDMTAAELRFTLDNITSIKETGRTLKEIERANLAAEIEDSKERILDVITGGATTLPSDKKGVIQEPPEKNPIADFLGNQQRAFESSLDRISRLDKGSNPYSSYLSDFMGRRTNDAFNQENVGEIDKIHEVAEGMNEIYKLGTETELYGLIDDLLKVVDLGRMEFADGTVKDNFEISRDQAIKKWMELQDPTLAERFSEGLNWGPAVIDAITKFLKPEDIAFGKWQIDFYRKYYPEINPVYSKEFGIDLPFHENYSPIMADVENTIPENVLLAKEMAKYATAKNASLKNRVDNKIALKVEGSMSVLFRHIVRMEHYKAWSDPMMRFRKILTDKTVRQAVIDFHGKDKLRILDNYVNDFARGGIAREKIVSGLDAARGRATKAILGLNWRVGTKQLVGILDYAIELPFSDFASGITSYWAHPLKNAKFLRDHSAGLRERFDEGYERDIKLAVSKNFAEKLTNSKKLSDKFFTFIRLTDKFTVNQGAWASYRSRFMEARRAGMSIAAAEKEGIYYAEQLTNRVQESSRLDTLSPLQRSGSWAKLFTMFQSQQNKYYRIVTDSLRNLKYGRGSKKANIQRLVMTWFIVPLIYNMVGNLLTPKKYQKKFGTLAKQTAAFGPLSSLLIAGQLVQSVYGWIEGDDFDYEPTAITGFASDLKNGIQKATTEDYATAITYLIDAAGKVSGVPTNVVTKPVRAGLK